MGLFSFLKNAGAKLLGKKAEDNDAAAAAAEEMAEAEKARLLSDIVSSSGIEVENLSIDFDDDKATIYGQTHTVADREKVILIVGNVEGVATVDDRISVVEDREVETRFHEVKSGESLSKIAKEYYGDAMKYPVIFEANKPMLSDPDKIYPGQMLRIPHLD